MNDNQVLASQFEEYRPHLERVAYRMLGSTSDANDALQDVWLRVSRAGADGVDNLGGWLTTITARVCLNVLRSRTTRNDTDLDSHVPDPIVTPEQPGDPEYEAVLADSVGLALMVVLDALTPAERLAFVLHDMFAVPFDDIAEMIDRSPDATRQLASRARRRVQGVEPHDRDRSRQREVVDAFFAAARGGDFDALVSVLHPDVVVRTDGGVLEAARSGVVKSADAVAGRAISFATPAAVLHPVLVNGAAGVVVEIGGTIVSIMSFAVHDGRVAEIDVLADPDRIAGVDLAFLDR
jgi:RNA polymerase sigma factor (sigma-70 family)